MKILVTIPHYYSHDPQGIYASNGDPERKAKNLRKLIVHLKTLFESPQAYCRYDLQNADGSRFTETDFQAGKPIARSLANYYAANEELHAKVDIILSTAGDRHALDWLGLPQGMYARRNFPDVDPKLLGFTCQDVLKEHRGAYDYYCYMEKMTSSCMIRCSSESSLGSICFSVRRLCCCRTVSSTTIAAYFPKDMWRRMVSRREASSWRAFPLRRSTLILPIVRS